MHNLITAFIDRLENIGSLGNVDLTILDLNQDLDTFHYIIIKMFSFTSPPILKKSIAKLSSLLVNIYTFSQILIFA